GAYSEYWPQIHMMPEETMKAFLDLHGKRLMPVHWAKFNLSLHNWTEPIKRLNKLAALNRTEILSPRIGAAFEVGVQFMQEEWWEE
ncbi:MAG: MBL fold metallo-hydrolase, partial [Chitinophagaceae bacterium]